ncbi:MAG: DUF72 domain-containing protein [Ignavibacteriaceae bacterium]|nr:DUF72 domain-containing protein [Ignavibacteriaceae bacterium]
MIRIGTCSWKYDSWKGIIYPTSENFNYLQEYSKHYNTVEIDQWFWSLFEPNKVVLPQRSVVLEYHESVPKDFKFTIKVPNSLTLTHFYNKNKFEDLRKNPHFLSCELFNEFLNAIEPLHKQIGCLMFQFEYLNKTKMPSQNLFMESLNDFCNQMQKHLPPIGIEIRNPNYLTKNYFEFLSSLNIYHVFLQGYYMPPIVETYNKYGTCIKDLVVIRLHGEDRTGIEKISQSVWNKIYVDRQNELKRIAELVTELNKRKIEIYLNINNHFEGSAPLTIKRIKQFLN